MSSDQNSAEIEIDEAIALASNGTVVLDVREQDEWDAGHAVAAQFVPLSELHERVSEVPTDGQVLVVCRSGGRSLRATAYLRSQGIDAVNVNGGMQAWAAQGAQLVAELPGEPHIR
jgi:rhodanese-related sulfurtransferase